MGLGSDVVPAFVVVVVFCMVVASRLGERGLLGDLALRDLIVVVVLVLRARAVGTRGRRPRSTKIRSPMAACTDVYTNSSERSRSGRVLSLSVSQASCPTTGPPSSSGSPDQGNVASRGLLEVEVNHCDLDQILQGLVCSLDWP